MAGPGPFGYRGSMQSNNPVLKSYEKKDQSGFAYQEGVTAYAQAAQGGGADLDSQFQTVTAGAPVVTMQATVSGSNVLTAACSCSAAATTSEKTAKSAKVSLRICERKSFNAEFWVSTKRLVSASLRSSADLCICIWIFKSE